MGSYLLTEKTTLHRLSKALKHDEIQAIKFLSKDYLSQPKLEKVKTGIDFFETLEDVKDTVDIDNFLYELLLKLGRCDLLKKCIKEQSTGNFKEIKKDVQNRMIKGKSIISPFRLFLKDVTDYATEDDIKVFKGYLTQGQLQKVENNNYTLIGMLEENGSIEPKELEIFENSDSFRESLQWYKDLLKEYNEDGGEEDETSSSGEEIHELPRYKMDSEPRGICIIINNKIFEHENSKREGTDIDRDKLKKTFQDLGFIVEIFENQKSEEIEHIMLRYGNQDHQSYDCFICCILSHGTSGHVQGSDHELVSIRSLWEPFTKEKCQSLDGKPKLFFIQACQGARRMEGVQVEPQSKNNNDVSDATIEVEDLDFGLSMDYKPKGYDFLLSFATVPGYKAFRSKSQGSWFISKLVEALNRYSDEEDLMSILVAVNDEVSKMTAPFGDLTYGQVPAPITTLRKKLYFKDNQSEVD